MGKGRVFVVWLVDAGGCHCHNPSLSSPSAWWPHFMEQVQGTAAPVPKLAPDASKEDFQKAVDQPTPPFLLPGTLHISHALIHLPCRCKARLCLCPSWPLTP